MPGNKPLPPLVNPYTPNAGTRPPAPAGRDGQIADFKLLIAGLSRGHTGKSMIITDLRGVGKTVLLGRFRQIAKDARWAVVEWELSKHDDTAFRRTLGTQFRTALLTLAPRQRWRERATRAVGVLRSFTLSVDPEGNLTAGLGAPAEDPIANSGDLLSDLTHLIVAVGEAAQEADRGAVMLLDEVQFLSAAQLESLISALHKAVQRALPVTLAGAGLPQVAQLAGEAKSHAERLFRFPVIGNLTDEQACSVLQEPGKIRFCPVDGRPRAPEPRGPASEPVWVSGRSPGPAGRRVARPSKELQGNIPSLDILVLRSICFARGI